MTATIFAACGFVFMVNHENSKVIQLTPYEAILMGEHLTDIAAEAFINFILTGDQDYMREVIDLGIIVEQLYEYAIESVLNETA